MIEWAESFIVDTINNDSYIFLFYDNQVMLTCNGTVPSKDYIDKNTISLPPLLNVGRDRSKSYYCSLLKNKDAISHPQIFVPLRKSYYFLELEKFYCALFASHILHWMDNNNFCGRCGATMEFHSTQRARCCSTCSFITFPRINPAIIIAIRKENKILLIKSKNRKLPFYTLIAGFVEPGESIEECVVREVFEETGIHIKNVSYICSQPWPFPDLLMFGFEGEYDYGTLTVNKSELAEAQWFELSNLPQIPPRPSIARLLIDRLKKIEKENG